MAVRASAPARLSAGDSAGCALFVSVIAGNLFVFIMGQLRAIAEAAGLAATGVATVLLARFAVDMLASILLFLVAFTLVSDRRINNRDVVRGAICTGLAFAIGRSPCRTTFRRPAA